MVNDVLLGHFRTGSKIHDSQVTFCGLKSYFIALEEAAEGGHGTEYDIEKQAGPQEELHKDKQPVSDAQLMPVTLVPVSVALGKSPLCLYCAGNAF